MPPSCYRFHVFYICAQSLQWCPTLYGPVNYSHPGSSAHGNFQAKMLEWVATSYSRGSSRLRDQTPHLLYLLHWQADSLPCIAPPYIYIHLKHCKIMFMFLLSIVLLILKNLKRQKYSILFTQVLLFLL